MAKISADIEIDAPAGRVWGVISDIDSEPRFWKGTKSIRNISRDGNTTTREITIAFRDQKCMQTVILEPESKIVAKFTGGVIAGEKTIFLEPAGKATIMHVVWEIQMTGMMGMFTGIISRHIKKGTEQAIQAIKKEIESNV
ncbi:MAG: SRPBCC family protein [Nitrosopumilus sp. B06]|nr:MAG: SRPBCC family protein [Nitrosopumilus sp. D6]RNJ79601.1 MAG: SRPBCC family protein [Nitrosopumilus sp. B06]